MTAAGTYPALLVQIAPGIASSAVPAPGDWQDVSAAVASLDIKTGRDDEWSQPSAGSLQLSFDNATGDFDPDNTAGAYYPYLVPLMWVRVLGGTTVAGTDVFYGQVSIEGFRLQATSFPDSMVSVTVLDVFEQMANTDLPSSVYAVEVAADAPAHWYRLGESSGVVAFDSAGGLHGTYEGGLTFSTRSGLIAEDADAAIQFGGADQKVTFGGQAHVSSYPFTVEAWVQAPTVGVDLQPIWQEIGAFPTAATFSILGSDFGADSGKASFAIEDASFVTRAVVSSAAIDDDGVHHVVVVATSASNFKLYVDGVDVTVVDTVGSPSIGSGYAAVIGNQTGTAEVAPINAILDEVAVYASALSGARVAAHYAAGTAAWEGELSGARITHLLDAADFPASLRNIGAGSSTLTAADLGKSDLLSAVQDATKAERGEFYVDHQDGGKVRFRGRQERWTATASTTSQATFGDGTGEVTDAGVDIQDDRIVNRATVQRAGGSAVTVEDAASAAQYQPRSYSETGLQIQSDIEVRSRGDLIVAEKKDRHRKVRSVTLEPRAPSHPAWAQVFARRIGDRVTVKWRPPYGGTYTFVSYIEGIAHSWAQRDAKWRTTFTLSPVPYDGAGTAYWVLGTSLLGVDTRVGF
jgi:hypothetical protein